MAKRSGSLLFIFLMFISQSRAAESPAASKAIAQKLLANISAPGTAAGSVIASPTRANPNYFYHWTRDSALVLDAVGRLAGETPLKDMLSFAQQLQSVRNPSGDDSNFFEGLGEPRFLVDGSPDTGNWCRPQSDGPALRAIAVSRLAAKGMQGLYSQDPYQSLLKADLEYVAHHWSERSCDLWEDTYGKHFYNLVVQRRALLSGAEIAARLNDPLAASYYRLQIPKIEEELSRFWDEGRGYLITTRDWSGGNDQKKSNLDASVILAANHGAGNDRLFGPTDDRIQATAFALAQTFRNLYPVNRITQDQNGHSLGVAIGRFPEDTYDGHGWGAGNPWFLLIHAMAEMKFRAAAIYQEDRMISITLRNLKFMQSLPLPSGTLISAGEKIPSGDKRFGTLISGLIESGDRDLARSTYHSGPDGSMNEQLDRVTGYMRGVQDLTWGYASLLTARWAREKAVAR